MATSEYNAWNAKGRPYTVALPIKQFVDQARAAGIGILGVIGNESHLKANTPEDHTPFSHTAWPRALPGYVVTACDIADGPWSDRILATAKDGRLPQVKYLNFRGHHYNVKRGWQQESSGDQHLHISVRTDHLNTPLAVNPFVAQAAPAKKGDAVAILGRTQADATVYLGDGFKCRPVTSMDQANRYAAAGAIWWTVYPDKETMFAEIGRPEAAGALDRIEAALKEPVTNIGLTPEQLSYFATSVASAVINGLLSALGDLLHGAAK